MYNPQHAIQQQGHLTDTAVYHDQVVVNKMHFTCYLNPKDMPMEQEVV